MSEVTFNRQELIDMGYEDAVIFTNPDYDSAILGVSHDGRVIYDYDLMIESLMLEDEMKMDEAMDFIDYNTVRALPYAGDNGPIILYKIGF